MFLKYQENKTEKFNKGCIDEKTNEPLDFISVIKSEKTNIIKMLVSNWLMLLFGYLGELNIINQKVGVAIGFIFFSYTFKILYSYYGIKSKLGSILFYFMFIFWSLYGVAAVFDFKAKNISYNILDLFAKKFYGLFLYYMIKKKAIK